jgi:membrane associated rhomboid family serine protease
MRSPSTFPQANDGGLLEAFRLHGDRTSSLATLGSQFESRAPAGGHGLLRVLDTPGALIAASEPLAPAERRADALAALAAQAMGAGGKRCVAMPLGRELAGALRARGFHVWQVGSEPVFRLAEYFAPGQDPYARHRVAQALSRRGAEVREVDLAALPEAEAAHVRAEMEAVAELWLADKDCLPLGFLARVEPFAQEADKRYFLLRVRGQLQGFVAAAPFCREGRVLGYYFQDMPRRPDARSGAGELLLLESMRLLAEEGVAEARLGMAPLAQLAPEAPGAGLLGLLFRRWTWGYNFRSVAEFKDKFAPTAWEPLYLASTCPRLATALADALRAHFPDGLLRPAIHLLAASGGFSLKPEAAPVLAAPPGELAPRSLAELLRRTWLTCALVLLFIGLHLGRLYWPPLAALFRASGYVPGDVSWQGVLLGPLFHNHWFHLLGDQLSFLVFGALIEVLLGRRPYLLLLAAGLWLSNPLTQGVCWALLSWTAPQAWAATLAEVDYGSSNAVFAMAGALAALLRQGRSVLIPFALYGLFICLARHSWLALHHLLTLGLGYAGLRWWMRRAGKGRG